MKNKIKVIITKEDDEEIIEACNQKYHVTRSCSESEDGVVETLIKAFLREENLIN